ncbi:MAG TPA: hypothetical protein VIJ28_03920 [Chloroflexota bacterium]|jgi:DNA-binding response OmpR family regulator
MIVDWLLPTVGGAAMVAGARQQYGAQVPILVLSAVANSELARQAGAGSQFDPELVEVFIAATSPSFIASEAMDRH